MALIPCYNRGCGKDFDPENNNEGASKFLLFFTHFIWTVPFAMILSNHFCLNLVVKHLNLFVFRLLISL